MRNCESNSTRNEISFIVEFDSHVDLAKNKELLLSRNWRLIFVPPRDRLISSLIEENSNEVQTFHLNGFMCPLPTSRRKAFEPVARYLFQWHRQVVWGLPVPPRRHLAWSAKNQAKLKYSFLVCRCCNLDQTHWKEMKSKLLTVKEADVNLAKAKWNIPGSSVATFSFLRYVVILIPATYGTARSFYSSLTHQVHGLRLQPRNNHLCSRTS